jgi:predicted dehydrogenase
MIPVEVATHVAGTLEFVSGAVVSIVMSFDVPRHRHRPIELYGTAGSLSVPDPNRFFGAIELATAAKDWTEQPTEHPYASGNYRIIGVADMAHAIRSGRPHRSRSWKPSRRPRIEEPTSPSSRDLSGRPWCRRRFSSGRWTRNQEKSGR